MKAELIYTNGRARICLIPETDEEREVLEDTTQLAPLLKSYVQERGSKDAAQLTSVSYLPRLQSKRYLPEPPTAKEKCR